MIPDDLFMLRAMELAQLGTGSVSPNPKVGCVIVRGGQIIGEGWHRKFGEAHAEVNALQSVEDKSLFTESTAYVNLEPCSHFGKTPPCADLLIEHKIARVVISTVDTNPLIAGHGITKLREAGVDVVTGVLEKEGRELNKRFFKFVEKRQPYIILKWAQTSDGFLARADSSSKWISNEFSRQLVHSWRSEEDAVLVGTNTAAFDDPHLDVREWSGRNPVRLVIDRYLRLPEKLNLWTGPQQTICYNTVKNDERGHLIFCRLDENNFIEQLVNDLYSRQIQSVIVEGGAKTLNSFIHTGLWDEARIFYSTKSFGNGIEAPRIIGNLHSVQQVFSDELKILTHVASSSLEGGLLPMTGNF